MTIVNRDQRRERKIGKFSNRDHENVKYITSRAISVSPSIHPSTATRRLNHFCQTSPIVRVANFFRNHLHRPLELNQRHSSAMNRLLLTEKRHLFIPWTRTWILIIFWIMNPFKKCILEKLVDFLPCFLHFDFVVVQLAKIKTDSSFHMGASELIN